MNKKKADLPMWEINMSFKLVDSRRTLQSKLRPPGASPPWSKITYKRNTTAVIKCDLTLYQMTNF